MFEVKVRRETVAPVSRLKSVSSMKGNHMTPENYVSSFDLNQITTRRASLTFEEAVAVWLMKWAGDHNHIIAAKLGINQGRIAETLHERLHTGSREKAFTLSSG